MNETIKTIIERRSIRKYKQEQITKEELNQILTAGSYAPSAGGRQSPVMVVVQNNDIISRLGRICRELFVQNRAPQRGAVSSEQPSIADDENIKSAFYGAPTLVVVFAPKTHRYKIEDATLVIGNMMTAAHSMNIGSCLIGRAAETFETPEGKEIIKDWNISDDYEAIDFCILGYPEGTLPKAKPRKEYVLNWIE